jgi:hypothetical protein
VEVVLVSKTFSLFIVLLFLQTLEVRAFEVYVNGEVKKESACCLLVKTRHGGHIKIIKPQRKTIDDDPFKVKLTLNFFVESVDYAFHYWKGKVTVR